MTRPFDITKILAPTDMGPATLPALRYARLFAAGFHAELTVLYSDPIIYPIDVVGPSALIVSSPRHEAALRGELVEYATAVLGDQPYNARVTAGQPIPSILECARELPADLIVVGTHLHHGWSRVLLGSVSDGVLFRSECPVLTVAADDRALPERVESIKTIVCPINYSDVALDSLRAARRLAQIFGADLVAVHVIERDELASSSEEERRVRSWIAPELDGVCSYRELVLRGGAAERVLDCAEDAGAGLIVVGAQHTFFRNATVIGTTADRLIRFASCPVFVVPRQAVAAEEEYRQAWLSPSVVL